jgi:hypothetical protein
MFKKINVLTDKIIVSNGEFSKAINSKKEFGIDIEGKVLYEKDPNKFLIFWGRANLVAKNQILGAEYGVQMSFVSVTIDLQKSWDRLMELNSLNALYEDHSAEGIDNFKDKELEEIHWFSVEFGITSRELATELENFAEGYLVGLEHEEPYNFSGLGFLNKEDLESSRKHLFQFTKEKIEEKIEKEKEEFEKYGFTEDQEESLEFFGVGDPFETK